MTTLTHTSFLPVIPGGQRSLFETAGRTLKKVASRLGDREATARPQSTFRGTQRRRQTPEVVYMRFFA
ncbi:hypothetical protein [Lutibaculum baratangense]|uniref:Uncharacterized protein n=1 Tax=Lutibaculum baratangense AMV1 TaxID=631454 RepID=V4QSA5_9HYPH|nr:hypothetical protein [Lutibaculum baratangense]ESR22657.1 hypothetical protein N177_3794 [Lutibaculum baratangense AMV1]